MNFKKMSFGFWRFEIRRMSGKNWFTSLFHANPGTGDRIENTKKFHIKILVLNCSIELKNTDLFTKFDFLDFFFLSILYVKNADVSGSPPNISTINIF